MDATEQTRPAESFSTRRLAHCPALPEVSDLAHFAPQLNRQLGLCRRGGTRLALILLEVDPESGPAGDLQTHQREQLLQAVGARLRARVRESDFVCRIGQARFGVALMGAGRSEVELVRARLHKLLWGPYSIEHKRLCLTLQTGIAVHRECGLTGAELTAAAARALGLRLDADAAEQTVPHLAVVLDHPAREAAAEAITEADSKA